MADRYDILKNKPSKNKKTQKEFLKSTPKSKPSKFEKEWATSTQDGINVNPGPPSRNLTIRCPSGNTIIIPVRYLTADYNPARNELTLYFF